MVCQEVDGLDTEYDPIKYRAVGSMRFSTDSMPGLRKSTAITLKKGTFSRDTPLFDYLSGDSLDR